MPEHGGIAEVSRYFIHICTPYTRSKIAVDDEIISGNTR